MGERDEILEEIAVWLERFDFREVAGCMAKKKRDREDAALRGETIRQTRDNMAREIRQLKTRRVDDVDEILAEIADLPNDGPRHMFVLSHAWPLVALNLVEITVSVVATSNSIPPETRWRVALTERGEQRLRQPAPVPTPDASQSKVEGEQFQSPPAQGV